MGEESVKVAVRVRPFNKRERNRNAECIIEMSGSSTTIKNPDDPEDVRTFSFDYSYWSHDGGTQLENGYFAPKDGSRYIGQEEVFNDIGTGVLKNAWSGYNTSLFAYGQTGSGKSWSVVGYGTNKGIVPRFCEEMFKEIDVKQKEGCQTEYEVVFSMLEIYNERVHDLLNPKADKKSLKVRQHPKKGFYADGLTLIPVKDYTDIEVRMEEGTKNRTIAATNMNATSSRAHTIVGVTFIQKSKNAAGEKTAKSSIVNLVDLAGSERADSTGATGDRLKEGAAINQSLSSLGNCIAALADRSQGKKVRVPYRDSVLTRLLKTALGGNSKTIMIAALSPADINYEETLSTLRYADRAKQIKTKAVVNEDPTEKLIRDLQEENEKLKAMLASGEKPLKIKNSGDDDDEDDDEDDSGLSEEEIKARIEEELSARMAENEREMKEMNEEWAARLAAVKNQNKEKDALERQALQERKTSPHLYNLNPDPMLSGMLVHLLKKGCHNIGRHKLDQPPSISLRGINILDEHGIINNVNDEDVKLSCVTDARILVNGEPLSDEIILHHNDRILFGSNHLYVFSHPIELEKLIKSGTAIPEVSYESAQEEIAKYSGMNVTRSQQNNENDDSDVIKEEMADLLPHINEANGMSEELDKKMQYEVVVLSGQTRGYRTAGKQVFVKVCQLVNGYTWFWSKEKFLNRKYVMQEIYEDFQNGDKNWNVPKERDPFYEKPDTESMIGVCEVYMKSLLYTIDIDITVPVVSYKGVNNGSLAVAVLPCDENGNHIENSFTENFDKLEGERLDFKIILKSVTGLPKRYTDIYCKYDLYTYENIRSNLQASSIDVTFHHEKQLTFDKCSKKLLHILANKPMIVQIWGKQKSDRFKPVNNAARLGKTTRDIMKLEALKKLQGGKVSKKPMVNEETAKMLSEALLVNKRMEVIQNKLVEIKKLCDDEEKKGEHQVMTSSVREIIGKMSFDKKKLRRNSSSSLSSSSSQSDESENDENKPKRKKKKKKKGDKKLDKVHQESEQNNPLESSLCVIV